MVWMTKILQIYFIILFDCLLIKLSQTTLN